jgi:hypothetical protein
MKTVSSRESKKRPYLEFENHAFQPVEIDGSQIGSFSDPKMITFGAPFTSQDSLVINFTTPEPEEISCHTFEQILDDFSFPLGYTRILDDFKTARYRNNDAF